MDPVVHLLQEWRDTPPKMEAVSEFLQLNPAVGTFPWLDLVEQALDDVGRGERNTIALLKISLHTDVRKQAYEQWSARHPDAPLTEFNQVEVAQLQREFGLPPTALTAGGVQYVA
ncbi:hypothetical protein EIP86_001741 [Pleurotus ostreatoroseus]|nr:hypothetical protein EIP86_001741 [Pleurotus ostreatoroseus]